MTLLNDVAKIFNDKRLNTPEMYSEPSRKSEIGIFAKIINDKKPLTILVKNSSLNVWLGSEHVSRSSFAGTFYILLVKETLWGKQ